MTNEEVHLHVPLSR